MIKLVLVHPGLYRAETVTGRSLGDIYREVDGYYVWWPELAGGCLGEGFLQAMADHLHMLNLEWDKQVREELGEDAEATVETSEPNEALPDMLKARFLHVL